MFQERDLVVDKCHIHLKVAIVLPVFNTARYLRECLNSFLAQTYMNFIIFAVNDGSVDDSSEILEQYAKKDSRICVINKKNGGVSSARNVALEKIAENASFDLVCFADSDDYVTPSYIATYVEQAVGNHADYVVCGWEPFDKQESIHTRQKNKPIQPKVLDRVGVFHQAYTNDNQQSIHDVSVSYFLNNRCFAWSVIQFERFDETLRTGEDQDFLVRALFNVRKGVVVSEVTYMYRLRLSSLSNFKLDHLADMDLLDTLIKKTHTYPDDIKEILSQRIVDLWWQSLRLAIKTKTYSQNKARFVEEYKKLKIFTKGFPLRTRIKKRFSIFVLGEYFLNFYFFFGGKETQINKEYFYE